MLIKLEKIQIIKNLQNHLVPPLLSQWPTQLINQPPDIWHCDKNQQAQFSRQFALNIFVELRAESVTAVMPALDNFILQSRHRAGTHMVSSLCVFLVSFADTEFNTAKYEPRIHT